MATRNNKQKIENIKDYSAMTQGELSGEIVKKREEVRKLSLEKTLGKERNVRKGYMLRKQLARMLTVVRNKELDLSHNNKV